LRIVELLESSRRAAVRSVNALMTATYWEIGHSIVEFEQGGAERAFYGDALIRRLAVDLTASFGRGYSVRNIEQMRRFYLSWPIAQTPSAQLPGDQVSPPAVAQSLIAGAKDLLQFAPQFPLPWSAYVRLLSVKNVLARNFYETEAIRGGWSVRQLNRQIDSQFYERTALSRNKVAMLARSASGDVKVTLTPEEAIKDPFVLEFLDLKDEYSESALEAALVQHLTDFLLELGDDFAFVGRQRRLRLDDSWFRVDLLFFHRRLKCLIVIELKTGKFSYADAGQMHMYLNYAREHWMKADENPPIGLILCAAKGAAEAHYSLDSLPNKVLAAEYQMVLPDESLLADELTRSRQLLEKKKRGT
jgi:predicted nuclease of restriction endonuclease-like (RecB) superfamily